MPLIARGESATFFLTKLDMWDVNDDHADLRLSDYNLECLDAFKKLSALRFIELKDFELEGGRGKGIAIIDGTSFKITYAWRGATEGDYGIGAKNSGAMLSWTVRIEGEKLKEHIEAWQDKMIAAERGPAPYRVPRHVWLTKVLKCKQPTRRSYRKCLVEHNNDVQKLLDEATDSASVERYTKMLLSKRQITASVKGMFSKKEIEIPKFMLSIAVLEPWTPKLQELIEKSIKRREKKEKAHRPTAGKRKTSGRK